MVEAGVALVLAGAALLVAGQGRNARVLLGVHDHHEGTYSSIAARLEEQGR